MKPPAIITCIVTFCLLAAGNNTHANQTDDLDVKQSAVEIKGTASQARTWEQLTPSASRFDWIQLTSDEWLKGDLESLYDGKVEFDSDELDLLVLDWEDVKKVRHTREPSSSAWNRLIVALGIDF